ncbi:hypothetical protein TURU_032090 [Turdus rufiventris]|nr:hypothetical protein TURU_032090 [Turdus rufiventris]
MITEMEKYIQETGIKGGGDICVKDKINKRRCDKVYEIMNITENGGEELVFFLYNNTELQQEKSQANYSKAKSLAKWSNELHIYLENQNIKIETANTDDMDYITLCFRE